MKSDIDHICAFISHPKTEVQIEDTALKRINLIRILVKCSPLPSIHSSRKYTFLPLLLSFFMPVIILIIKITTRVTILIMITITFSAVLLNFLYRALVGLPIPFLVKCYAEVSKMISLPFLSEGAMKSIAIEQNVSWKSRMCDKAGWWGEPLRYVVPHILSLAPIFLGGISEK